MADIREYVIEKEAMPRGVQFVHQDGSRKGQVG
jgi:hypothetical protein